MSEQTLRHQGLDLLRLLSVVMVIGIHTAGGYFIGESSLSERCQAAPWYALSVGAVPLFVMLSGAFMLSPTRQIGSLAHFYKCSVGRKILLPLVVWSVVYYLWHCAKEQAWLAFQWYHLWYLVMLAGLYVVTPMLRWLCERIERHLWGQSRTTDLDARELSRGTCCRLLLPLVWHPADLPALVGAVPPLLPCGLPDLSHH